MFGRRFPPYFRARLYVGLFFYLTLGALNHIPITVAERAKVNKGAGYQKMEIRPIISA